MENKRTMDQRARLAIDGMLPGEMQKKLEAYENLYSIELAEMEDQRKASKDIIHVCMDEYGAWMQASPRWWRKLVAWTAKRPVRIINEQLLSREELATKERLSCDRKLEIVRAQVEELALTFQKRENDLRANEGQKEVFTAYTRMLEDNRQFRSFFHENFREELKVADAENIGMIALAKRLLLEKSRS